MSRSPSRPPLVSRWCLGLTAPVLLAALTGCAAGPKPKALDNAEQLFVGPRAPALRQEKPKLLEDAERFLRAAKDAYDNGESEDAIVYAYAASARFQMAEDLVAAASARKLAQRVMASASPEKSREVETDRYLEVADRIDALVARLDSDDKADPQEKEAKKAILAARDKQSEAIGKDAPRLAPTDYAQGTSHVSTAVESLELEIYDGAIRESQKAIAAFEKAMKEASKPDEPEATAKGEGGDSKSPKRDGESAQKRAEEAIVRARASRARAGAITGAERSPDFAEGTSLLGAAESSYESQDWGEARKLAVDAKRKFEAAAKTAPKAVDGSSGGAVSALPAGKRKKTVDMLVDLQMRRAELIGEGRDISCRDTFGEFDAILQLAKERLEENDVDRAWEFLIRAQERIKKCESLSRDQPAEEGASEEDKAAREGAARAIRKAQSELASARGRAPKAREVREGSELLSSAEQWFDRGRYSEASTLAEQAAARLRSARAERPTPKPTPNSTTPDPPSREEQRAARAIEDADEAQLGALERGAKQGEMRLADKRLDKARKAFDRGRFREASRLAAQAKGAYAKLPNKGGKEPRKPKKDDCETARTKLVRARAIMKTRPPNDAMTKSAAALLEVASGEVDKRRCTGALDLLDEVERLTGEPLPGDDDDDAERPGDGPLAPPAIGTGDETPWGSAHQALEDALDARKKARRRNPDASSDSAYGLGQDALERAKAAYEGGKYEDAERNARLAESAFDRIDGDAPSVDVTDGSKKPKPKPKPKPKAKPKPKPGAEPDVEPAPKTPSTSKKPRKVPTWRKPYFVVYEALELRDQAKAKAESDEAKKELREGEEELAKSRTLWAKKKYVQAAAHARNAKAHFERAMETAAKPPAPEPEVSEDPKEPEGASREEADAALREARVVRKLCERDECKERDFEALTRAEEALTSAQESFEKDKFGYAVKLADEATEQMNAILAKPRKDKPKPPAPDPKVEAEAREAVAQAEIQQKLCENRDCDKIDLEAWLLAQKDFSAAKSAKADSDFERATRLANQASDAYKAIKTTAPTFEIPADAGGVRRSGDQLFLTPRVEFGSGSTVLPPDAKSSVEALAKVLKANQDQLQQVRIVGYTDNSGNQILNQRLSARRANAVRRELIQDGVPANLVVAEGKGPENPIADNSTAAGRKANRRVEVRFTLKGATP